MGDANERFEILAMLYYKRFRQLAPGKDVPAIRAPEYPSYEERMEHWREWLGGKCPYDAADRIIALEADNQRLRAALEPFAKVAADTEFIKVIMWNTPNLGRYIKQAALALGKEDRDEAD